MFPPKRILCSHKENMVFIDHLPDPLMLDILRRIDNTIDRNAISLACKRFYNLDKEQRKHLHVGCGLNPADEALTSLCHRFPNLDQVKIAYSGCMSEQGKQSEDPSFCIPPNICLFMTNLTLSYCTSITDAGLSSLASCSKLSSLTLSFTPGISGSGLRPIVSGCKNLKKLHLFRCLNISDCGWICCFGRQKTLEDLCIKNCRGIGESDLYGLWATWGNIKSLQFEVDPDFQYQPAYDTVIAKIWQGLWFPCENMVELSLTNCIIRPGKGLACILGKCKNLEKIHLDMCKGARDSDIIRLAQNSKNLRSVSIRVPSDSALPLSVDDPRSLTDNSLKSLAQNCTRLESVSLSFSDGEVPSLSSFSLDGILSLVKMCPVKNLFLDGVYCFNNTGMEALCDSDHLQTLELISCQQISDQGLIFVARYLCLRVLRLTKCLGVTDDGFKPLIGSSKLELLAVNDCSQVSLSGVQGAAKSVTYS